MCINFWIYAQDVIVLKTAEEINAKVLTVGSDEITYKKWDYTDGPTYSIQKSEVFMIKYANGTKDVFSNENTSQSQNNSHPIATSDAKPKQLWKYIDRVMFNGYTEVGCVFRSRLFFPSINFSFGARIFDYGYVGLGPGLEYMFADDWYYYYGQFSVPILFSFRFFYPAKETVSPFLELSVGPDVFIWKGGYNYVVARVNFTGGVELKRFVIGLGYNYMGINTEDREGIHLGVFKIGVKMGPLK